MTWQPGIFNKNQLEFTHQQLLKLLPIKIYIKEVFMAEPGFNNTELHKTNPFVEEKKTEDKKISSAKTTSKAASDYSMKKEARTFFEDSKKNFKDLGFGSFLAKAFAVGSSIVNLPFLLRSAAVNTFFKSQQKIEDPDYMVSIEEYEKLHKGTEKLPTFKTFDEYKEMSEESETTSQPESGEEFEIMSFKESEQTENSETEISNESIGEEQEEMNKLDEQNQELMQLYDTIKDTPLEDEFVKRATPNELDRLSYQGLRSDYDDRPLNEIIEQNAATIKLVKDIIQKNLEKNEKSQKNIGELNKQLETLKNLLIEKSNDSSNKETNNFLIRLLDDNFDYGSVEQVEKAIADGKAIYNKYHPDEKI